MNNDQLTKLIADEVAKSLQVERSPPNFTSYKVLCILAHLSKDLDHIINYAIRLSMGGENVLVWTLKHIDDYYQLKKKSISIATLTVQVGDENSFGLPKFDTIEKLVFGGFSFELADKIINLKDAQDPLVNILLQGLIAEIPVYLLTPIPITELVYEYKPSSRVNSELRARVTQLAEMGFYLLDERDLTSEISKPRTEIPDLITEDYIEKLRGKTHEVRIPHTAIITPLAKEKAMDLEIRIIRI